MGFGCVGSGECEIFLCLDGQVGRGKGNNTTTFQNNSDEQQDKGCWISVWVDDVDQVFQTAKAEGIEVTCEPEDMPWGVRECHLTQQMPGLHIDDSTILFCIGRMVASVRIS